MVKFGPVDLKKMMLPDDDGPQTTAKGHLNDSGYLKSTKTINKNKNPVKSFLKKKKQIGESIWQFQMYSFRL